MKFYPPPSLRFCFRYLLIGLFVGLPVWLTLSCMSDTIVREEDRCFMVSLCVILVVFGMLLIHFAFWEKCFASLLITDTEIRWECPFRVTRVMSVTHCVEVGAYLENVGKGIPTEQIYFSDYANPKRNMPKNGALKPSRHLIKFWYSESLYRCIKDTMPGNKTGALSCYRIHRTK